MTPSIGQRIAAGALAQLGAPFRLHGRHVETGLDCVGLVLLALRHAGADVAEPPPYTLRGAEAGRAAALIDQAGLIPGADSAIGDIVLAQSGPLQLHLMVQAERGFVHAHASLGRVVLMPGPSPWPITGRWFLPDPAGRES